MAAKWRHDYHKEYLLDSLKRIIESFGQRNQITLAIT